ncbi:hypothetical protein HY339_03085 [Candidatus Gottesmanbacteria bacterium]|nr:hypothetical protein [Candidatus Gottesmanbacteria bacterium]
MKSPDKGVAYVCVNGAQRSVAAKDAARDRGQDAIAASMRRVVSLTPEQLAAEIGGRNVVVFDDGGPPEWTTLLARTKAALDAAGIPYNVTDLTTEMLATAKAGQDPADYFNFG